MFSGWKTHLKKLDILVKVPKSEEFPYYDVLSNKLIPMIENAGSGGFFKFDTLLDNLHTPPVHYKEPKPNYIIKVQVKVTHLLYKYSNGVATIVQGAIVQGDSCPRDCCPS